jgi:small subunit ribosomal protein S1
VSRVARFGVFVELADGVEGLIPVSETGLAQDADLKRTYPTGAGVDVVILEVDAAARRVRLSIRAIASASEADDVREYSARQDAAPSVSVGSLADKLRGALGKR